MVNKGSVVKAFTLGAALGAVIALFTAPQSGRTLRAKTRHKLARAQDMATEKSEELKEKAYEGAHSAKRSIARLKDRGVLLVKKENDS